MDRRSILDTQVEHTPLSILNEDYQPPEPVVEEQPWSKVWDAAKQRDWLWNTETRRDEANKFGGYQEGYVVPVDSVQAVSEAKRYTDSDKEFLFKASSPENLQKRVEILDHDKEAKLVLQNAGWTGIGAETLAGIADPSMIPTIFLSAPVSVAGRFGKAGVLATRMLEGATIATAQELALMQGDTQRDDEDLIRAGLSGFAFTGLIHGAGVALKYGTDGAKNIFKAADTVERIGRDGINESNFGKAYNQADRVLSNEITETVPRKVALSEKDIIQTLRNEIGEQGDVLSRNKLQAIKEEFRIYKASREAIIESIKLRPNVRPSARAKEIAQVTSAINTRQSKLDELVSSNQAARDVRGYNDALQQGKIPDSLRSRYEELKAENGEFDVPVPTIREKVSILSPVTKEGEPNLGGVSARESIGAMKTRRDFDDINTSDFLLTREAAEGVDRALSTAAELGRSAPRASRIVTSKIAAPLRSLSSELDTAPDDVTRGMALQLVKSPWRIIDGHQSAAEIADTNFARIEPHFIEEASAFEAHLIDKGINTLDIGKVNEARIEFDKEAVLLQAKGLLLSNAPVAGDSPIMLAAKARSRIYEESLKYNKDGNVVGFDDVTHRHEYHSVVFDGGLIQAAHVNNHMDTIVDSIAAAYETGGIKVSRENAIKLAESQIAREWERTGGNDSSPPMMSSSDFSKLADELREKGVGEEIIDDVKNSLFNKTDEVNMSARAMFSLRPNLQARSGDVWLVDLIDTSMERVMKYASEASANNGLAAHGYHSRAQLQAAIAEARLNSMATLADKAKSLTGKAAKEAQRQFDLVKSGKFSTLMDEAVRQMYREPLEGHSGITDALRLSRKIVSVERLRASGLMSLPEYATAAVRNGVWNTLQQLPQSRMFNLSDRSIAKDEFMMFFAKTFGATGHQDYLFGRKFFNNAGFSDTVKSSLKRTDKVLGGMLNVTMTVNGFRTIQHAGEEMVARAIVSNIRDMAVSGKITGNVRKSLMKAGGATEDTLNKMIVLMKANPTKDVFDVVRMLDAKAASNLATAVRSTIGNSFMRFTLGELPPYMNKEAGKLLTSLMSFTIGSYEKMLVRGIKGERAMLLASSMAQAVLGTVALYANTYIQANRYEGRKRQEYIDKMLSDEGVFWGVMNRVGVLSGPMLYMQGLKSSGLTELAKPLGASEKGIDTMQGLSGIQSVEMAKDFANASTSAVKLATQRQSQRDKDNQVKAIQNVIPWYNSTLWNLTYGVAK